MSLFSPAKPKGPPPPPSSPTRANAASFVAGAQPPGAARPGSLISTAPLGLDRKAETRKTSLIGG